RRAIERAIERRGRRPHLERSLAFALMPLVVLSAFLHATIGWRIVPALPRPWGVVFAVLLAASATLLPLGLGARRIRRQPLADRLAAAGLWCLGLFSSLLVLTVL